MRCALHTSKAVCFKNDGQHYDPLTLPEVLYMATMGGASGEGTTHKSESAIIGKRLNVGIFI